MIALAFFALLPFVILVVCSVLIVRDMQAEADAFEEWQREQAAWRRVIGQ